MAATFFSGCRGSGPAALRALAVLAVIVTLTACAHTESLEPTPPRTVAPAMALMFPPIGGPGILAVVETRFANATRQDISLATDARTPGENKISIIVFEGKGGDGSDGELADVPFTEINLTEEALAAFPGSGMSVSPYYVQNDYGPFGYAVGKPGTGDTCLYAWQRIEPALRPSGAIARGAVVIRLQLCDRRHDEQSLLGVMYQLRVNAPVFEPWQAPAQIGRVAMPIMPNGPTGFVPVIAVAPTPVARAPRPAAPVAVAPVALPAGAPIVPLPGGISGQVAPIVPLPAAYSAPSVIVPKPSGVTP